MADSIYLIRHAAPPIEKRGRYWGKADPGIDAGDLANVSSLAPFFRKKPLRLLTSPIPRAAATAAELGACFSLPAETDPDLSEIDFGLFDGLSWTEIERDFPEKAAEWAEKGDGFAFPGGEAVEHFLLRIGGAWRRICDSESPAVAVVSHGGVIPAWICLFLDLPLSRRFQFSAAYGALTAFERKKGGGWNMVFFNSRV